MTGPWTGRQTDESRAICRGVLTHAALAPFSTFLQEREHVGVDLIRTRCREALRRARTIDSSEPSMSLADFRAESFIGTI
ncbi:MAG: hypothetical protein JWO80_3832 [Bryobacterales bacterium]|nr:hypothetical protein [Bryobacterales bacterium]